MNDEHGITNDEGSQSASSEQSEVYLESAIQNRNAACEMAKKVVALEAVLAEIGRMRGTSRIDGVLFDADDVQRMADLTAEFVNQSTS